MKKLPHNSPQWQGYTMDRLVYERAVTLARIELEKERIVIEGNRVRRGNLVFSKSTFSRMLGMLNYADYLVLGVKLWQRVAPLFRRGKHERETE